MSSIGAFPKGLLSMLQSQNFGINPKELSDTVVPVVDVVDCYALSAQFAPANSVVLANLNNDILTVPAGKVWRVAAAGAIVIAGVGVTGACFLTVRTQSQNVPISETMVFAASTTRPVNMTCPPFWLQAGDRINLWGDTIAGAPTATVCALVSEFNA